MGSVRRNLILAWCFGIIWMLVILTYSIINSSLSYTKSNIRPTDKEMLAKFKENKDRFLHLASLIQKDKNLESFRNNGIYTTFDSTEKLDVISVKRYQELLKELDVLMFSRQGKQKIYFQVWKSENFQYNGKSKGLVHKYLEDSDKFSDDLYEFDEELTDLKYIDMHWYLF